MPARKAQTPFWTGILLAAALCLAACTIAATGASTNIHRIVSTTSFGECLGYCATRLEISEGQAVLTCQANARGASGHPEQRFQTALTPAEWQEIARLAANAKFDTLPPVIGCPDCADGGAESLAIEGDGATRSVSFDFGARVQPVQPLLDRVRALRTRMMPQEQH